MKRHTLVAIAIFTASLACGLRPARAQFGYRYGFSLNTGPNPDRCSDLQLRTSGRLARDTQTFTVAKASASPLEVSARDRSSLYVRGWDRPDYSIEVCKFAVASSQSAADSELRAVSVNRTGARFTASGPSDSDARWHVAIFIHAPKDAAVTLDTSNGPVDARDVNGKLTLHAVNGPLALERCSGAIQAETVNGPISMSGGSGDVHLIASNGPISVRLADSAWSGAQLEARTSNGPLSVVLPSGFTSGVRVETSGHAPVSCAADACSGARTEGSRFFPHTIQLNGSSDVIRLSTRNGPVSVRNAGTRRARVI